VGLPFSPLFSASIFKVNSFIYSSCEKINGFK
jgi:hypothetical protein